MGYASQWPTNKITLRLETFLVCFFSFVKCVCFAIQNMYALYINNNCISKMQNSVHFIVEREKQTKTPNSVLNVHRKTLVVTSDHTFVQTYLDWRIISMRCQSRCFLSSTGDLQTSFRDWLVGRRRRALLEMQQLLSWKVAVVVDNKRWYLAPAGGRDVELNPYCCFSETKMPKGIFHKPPARNVN